MAATTFSNDGDVSFLHDPGHSDAWLVKLDNSGGIIWEKSLGGSRWEIPTMILQLSDGGYLLGVSSNSADGDIKNGNLGSIDWWIVRLDAGGNILWEKTLGGMLDETPHAAIQIGDEFLITGITASSDNWVSNKTDNSNDLWMVRMDDTGQLIWENTYGTPTLDEGGLALFANQDGYMVAAEASGDIWLITFDSELNITWGNISVVLEPMI